MSDPAIIEAAARALRDYNNDDENPILTDDDYIRAVLAAVTPLLVEAAESFEGFLDINERQFNNLPPAPDSKAWQFAKKRLETGRDICARLRALKEQP